VKGILTAIFILAVLLSTWRSLVLPFAEQFYYLVGGDVLQLGVLESALTLLAAISPLVGLLAISKLGLRYTVSVSILFELIGLALFSTGMPPLILVAMVVWSTSRMRAPALKSAVASSSGRKGSFFGILDVVTGVISVVGPAASSLALLYFGTFVGFKFLLTMAFPLAGASLIVAMLGLRDSAREISTASTLHSDFKTIMRGLRGPALSFMLLECAEGLGYLYPIIAVSYGCEPWMWGLAVSVSRLVSLPAPLLSGLLSDRLAGSPRLLSSLMLSLTLLSLLAFVAPSYFCAVYVAMVFCGTAIYTAFNAFVAYSYSTDKEREVAYASLDTLGALGASIAAPLGAIAYAAHGPSVFLLEALWTMSAALLLYGRRRAL